MVEWHAAVLGSAKDATALATQGNTWSDVRDVAKAHVRAIQRAEAVGRIIVSTGRSAYTPFKGTFPGLIMHADLARAIQMARLAYVSHTSFRIQK